MDKELEKCIAGTCLHCGSENSTFYPIGRMWKVGCIDCQASGGLRATKAQATAAWNRRYVCPDKNGKPVYAGNEVNCIPLDYVKITHPSQGIIAWCDLIYGWTIAVGKVRYAMKDFGSIKLIKTGGGE